MSDVSRFNVLGKIINIKDAVARQSINELNPLYEKDGTEIVWLGDSFTTGFQFGGSYLEYTIPKIVSNKLKLNMHNYGVNASGYVTIGDGGSTFYSQAINSVNDNSYNHNKVKYVCILGGINDYNNPSVNEELLNSASVSLINYLYHNFPNAKVIAIPNWGAVDTGANTQKFLSIGNIDTGNYDRPYLFLKKNIITLQGRSDLMCADNVHPNQLGATYMSECIYSMINGVEPNVHRSVPLIPNEYWDISNFEIKEDFNGWTLKGSVSCLKDIYTINPVTICEVAKGFTFFGVPYTIAPSVNGTGACCLEFYPGIDLVDGGQNGKIYMFHDLGVSNWHINVGDNILIDYRINKCDFI